MRRYNRCRLVQLIRASSSPSGLIIRARFSRIACRSHRIRARGCRGRPCSVCADIQDRHDLLKHRLNANLDLKQLLSAAVQKWGVEIAAVELKDLDIPENMQRAIAKEAEAIREKRARIIKADGELEAATKLNEAAAIIAPHPSALELRRLQALTEIGVEHNSVIIVSLPVENNATAMSAARQIDR